MKAAIIDDLALCREELQDCLNRYLDENYAGETPMIHEFESGEAFLSRFVPGAYDIIFIDQYMDGLSGIDTAQKSGKLTRLSHWYSSPPASITPLRALRCGPAAIW